ncbi:hypothetical protein Tco_1515297 [Tanacetum coccineum]
MDSVRGCLLLVAELVFMGKEDRNCIPRHLVSLVEDFDYWNDYQWGEYMWVKFYKRTVNVAAKHRAFLLDKKKQNPDYYPTYNLYGFPLAFKIWILESYPNSRKWWSKKDNVLPRALAWSNVFKFGKNDYNGLLGPDSNPNLKLYATPVEQQTKWFKASIEYINGLVDMNVSEDDIGGDVSNNSFDLNDNAVSDKQDQQDKQPSLADVLYELRALRKEVALIKVDDARIAKLERFMNDNFIPCNDRSKGNHNAVNPGLTTSANHPLSTCSRHVVDNPEVACAGTGIHNPARNNDSRNSNHNVVYKGLSCSANDHMSSCFSPEMPNDEVVVAGTAIHNADEMYDSPNCVTDNDVNERIGVSSNYSMSNTSCPEMHNAKVLVAGMGIDKVDENIYNPNANDNDVNQGIAVSFNAHMSNSSGHDMPNVVVVVACMGIDKPDGHNDNPNANDNDVNQGIDPMSTCFGPDMHLAEVVVAGMEIDKGDEHIHIPTASDNDVNLAKSVSVNDLMVLAICSMGFQNEVAPNAVYEGNVVSAKEGGLDVLIQVICDSMGIDKADGYSQREPSTLNALIEGFDSQNNNPGIDFLQHDDHVDCSVAKPNDHPSVNKARGQKKRKKSDMKTNYVLRSAKERKKRLAMVLESPFGQQPPTTPVPPKRISRSVNCDFILPPDFEEDVSGQPKMRSINELMTMEVFVEQLSRPQNCKKDKVSLPDGLAEYLQMKDPPNYRFPWGYRDIPVDREFWLVLAYLDKSKQGWLKDSLNEHRVLHSKGIAVERYEITYKFLTIIEQADLYGDCDSTAFFFNYGVRKSVNDVFYLTYNHGRLGYMIYVDANLIHTPALANLLVSNLKPVGYERVFGDSGDSYKHYLLVSFDMINHRFQEIAIPNLLMRGLDSPLYVSKLRNSLVLSGNIPTPAYYVFVCCQLSINGGSITSFPAIMTMPTHHFTKLMGFNNQDEPIVEVATVDVMGHRVQVYMENSQSFEYVDIQGNAGSFFVDLWTGGLMCYVDLAKNADTAHYNSFYWIDPELTNPWYMTQIFEMYLTLNPDERHLYHNQITAQNQLKNSQNEFDVYQQDM